MIDSTTRTNRTSRGKVLAKATARKKSLAGAYLVEEHLEYANLPGADLHSARLTNAFLTWAVLTKADLSYAKMGGCHLRHAGLCEANLEGVHLGGALMSDVSAIHADFHNAHLTHADLTEASLAMANLRDADLTGADLSRACLRGADLTGAYLSGARLFRTDLSGAIGMLDPIDWLNDHFIRDSDGSLFVFKTFGAFYPAPDRWEIKPGGILFETVNSDRTLDCGSGINVATVDWIIAQSECDGREVWECRIRPEWQAGIVVPYNTDGKFRCSRLELVRHIDPYDLDDE